MKKDITTLCIAKFLAFSLFFCLPIAAKAQILFTQDFSSHSSETLTPYIGTGTNQFDFLGATPFTSATPPVATTSTIRVANVTYPNQLRLFRGNTTCAFVKKNLSPTPDILKIKFKMTVASSSFAAGTTATFAVGSNFTADAVSEPDANVHSRFGLGFTNNPADMASYTSGTFVLRNLKSFLNTPQLTGQQEIIWFINNSGVELFYTNPNGIQSSVLDDKADIWIGTSAGGYTLNGNLNGMSAFTGSQAITDFKFTLTTGGVVVIDEIQITTGTTIPITLSSFTAKKTGVANQLTWTTETEFNNEGYNIERQTANGEWTSIGFVKGENKPSTYIFEDKDPLSISYYRLRQVDYDGKESLSKIVSVAQNQKGNIRLSPNPTSDKINVILPDNDGFESTAVTLFDMVGRQVLTQKTTANALELDMSNLAKGTYLVKIDANNSVFTEKIIRQ